MFPPEVFCFYFFSKASPGVDDVTEGAVIDLWVLNLWLPTYCQQHLLFLESGEEHRWSHFTISVEVKFSQRICRCVEIQPTRKS